MTQNADNDRYAAQLELVEQIDQKYESNQTRDKLGILTELALAAALNVTPTTLATWRGERKGPPYSKPSKQVFYRIHDVQQWLAGSVVRYTKYKPKPERRPEPEEAVL